jgi:CIC family chloride channel protein
VAAGVLAAGAPVIFHWLVEQVELIATGHRGGLEALASSLPPWRRVAICTLGGTLAGLILQWGNRFAAAGPLGQRHIDYLDAVRAGTVVLNNRTTATRTLSALVSIGTGASIGREGPMVQLAAWATASLARIAPVKPEQKGIILACGIAAGIGSAYHAPIAGIVFVLELALGFFAGSLAAPLLIATAAASSIVYWLFEPHPLYVMDFARFGPSSLVVAAVGGLAFGLLGWSFLRALEQIRIRMERVRSLPIRLGLGGLVVGLISAWVPQVWGNGFSAISQVLQDAQPLRWVMLVLVAKCVATLVSNGSGAIGGAFTPSIFLGAMSGNALAHLAAQWLPADWVGDPRTFSLIGMAAVLTAVTHSPLMAIVMILEMTNQFQLTIPVMLACGGAYLVSTQLGARPLFGNPIELPR